MAKFITLEKLARFANNMKQRYLTSVAYDTSAKKFTKTINGTTSDIVATSQIKTDMDLGDAADYDVANNLTTTAAGSVLDARQGKALNDAKQDDVCLSIVNGQLCITYDDGT